MSINSEVVDFLSEWTELDRSLFVENFDLVSGIDWSKKDEDEGFSELMEDFVDRFEVYVPEHDFNSHAMKKNIFCVLYPFYFVIWRVFIFRPLKINSLTVGELTVLAQTKVLEMKIST